MGSGAALSATDKFIRNVIDRRVTPAVAKLERRVLTPYGAEQLNGALPVLDAFFPGVAALRPLAEVSRESNLVRLAEYAPESLDVLDLHLSNPENGSPLYRKAKESLYNLSAQNPAKSRTVRLGSQQFSIASYRPRLSEWLIRGLAERNCPLLVAAGITPGPGLEARLLYAEGNDFAPKQYEAMAAALSEIVEASGLKVRVRDRETGEEKDGTPSIQTFRGYLEGEVNHPMMAWWELLSVFGSASPNISEAYRSKSKEPFLNQEGFYWAVRMFDTLRSFMRKRQFYTSIKSAAEKERNGSWDYIPASKILAQISAGHVEPIDEFYDKVRVAANDPIPNEKQLRIARASQAPNGIYVHDGRFPNAPRIAIKQPKELLVEFFSLYNMFNAMVLVYFGKTGDKMFVDGKDQAISPTGTVLSKFVPRLDVMVMSYLKFDEISDPDGGHKDVPPRLEEQVNSLIGAIKGRTFDAEVGLPEGTLLQLTKVMKLISERIPAELPAYLFLSNQIRELETYTNLRPSEKEIYRNPHVRAQLMRSIGLPEDTNFRLALKVLDRLKSARIRVAKSYEGKYGGTLKGFVGITSPHSLAGLELRDLARNGNGRAPADPMDRFYPDTDYYVKNLLPTYGLSALAPYAHLALTDQIEHPSPEFRNVLPPGYPAQKNRLSLTQQMQFSNRNGRMGT